MPWASVADAVEALGSTPVGADGDYLTSCVDAANSWAVRRRAGAGYTDDPDIAPDAAAQLGTVLYAVALYRERGTTDSYPSFEDLAAFAPTGTATQIRRLLGIDRPAVDAPPTVQPL